MNRGISKILALFVVLSILSFSINGYCFFSRKTKAESVKTYDKAHELYLKGNYKEAEKLYQEFMKKHPDSLLVQTSLYYTAKCYTQQKEYDKALSSYKTLVVDYKEGFWVDTAKDEMLKIRSLQKGK